MSWPNRTSCDVVIIGGASTGAAVACFLALDPDFDGSVLVVEPDPSYEFASTSRTNSCIRQQFSTEVNIRMSQFGAAHIRSFREALGGDPEIPEIAFRPFGYLNLAATESAAAALRANREIQAACGVAARLMTPDEVAAEFPFYALDDVILASHNPGDEGWFDGATMVDWRRRVARRHGVEFLTGEVAAIERDAGRVTAIGLASGARIACGWVVNAAGTRARKVAEMAGLTLPIEPRKRFSFVFSAARPLERELPLTVDPSGVHVRSDGANYLAGVAPADDRAVAHDDFEMDPDIWMDRVWPALARRIPAFEAVRVVSEWAGHYAYNTLDANAVIGPAPDLPNFLFANGFSGHGLQQAPAVGRGIAELVAHGGYRTLDLSPLGYERILSGKPMRETAII